mgnify:CR=1 FL=1
MTTRKMIKDRRRRNCFIGFFLSLVLIGWPGANARPPDLPMAT